MRASPRSVRPHKILLKNFQGEVAFKADYQDCNIDYVKFDGSYGIKQSEKGIQTDDKALIVIDMNDLIAYLGKDQKTYLEPFDFEALENTEAFFTFRPDIDKIIYKNNTYTVTSVNIINPLKDTPEYIEVTVK